MRCCITSPSCSPILSISLAIRSEPNKRIRLSSSETKNCEDPGSPCLPALPRSCLSTLLDSCLSVPMMASPPASLTPGANLMSVPLPAILVAMVTTPGLPASATISASFWCSLAFSTLCFMPRSLSIRLKSSDISTEVVPTNTGLPALTQVSISSITALYFSRVVLYTKSSMSLRTMGLLVGITTTSNL